MDMFKKLNDKSAIDIAKEQKIHEMPYEHL